MVFELAFKIFKERQKYIASRQMYFYCFEWSCTYFLHFCDARDIIGFEGV